MAASIMRCSALSWIFSLTLFTLFMIPFATPLSYSDHCASFVPEATPQLYSIGATLPFYQSSRGYYSGGDPILKDSSSSTFTFKTQGILKTDHEGVVKVDAELIFMLTESGGSSSGADTGYVSIPRPGIMVSSSDQRRSSVNFRLEGFWSASSGRLCMVGSSYVTEYDNHKDLNLKAVLKLNNVHSSASITNLVTGTLEGLSSPDDKKHHHLHGGFDSISMLMFPQKNYTYNLLDPQEIGDPPSELINLPLPSRGLYRDSFCSMLDSWSNFHLKYAADCDSVNDCSPFQGSDLLQSMVPYVIGCDCGGTHVRVLLQFSNQSSSSLRSRSYSSISFEPKTALVGEGFWDEKKNLLRFNACRISMTEKGGSLSAARVEDCSISFSFWNPTVWSIKERDSIVGEIWSKKSPTESGYFGKITARKSSSFRSYGSNQRYEYSQIERVRALCPQKNKSGSGQTYPDWDSNDLSFEMSVETLRGKKIGDGYSYPLFVGDQVYRQQYSSSKKNYDAPVIKGKPSQNSQLSISYTISFSRSDNVKLRSGSTIFNGSYSSSSDDQIGISAEGVYDGATGSLCMVGCRSLVYSMDCEILIKLQFPPLDYSKKARYSIKGSIESVRKRSDPLYFDTLKVSTAPMYKQSARSIWRLDSKRTIILLSNTLSCIFAALQLYHVRKNPHVVPFASWIMLTILALGHAIPLMLNFKGSFQDDYRFRYIGESETWVHASEVLVRVATLVALLFEFCLLQQTLFRRNDKSLVAEKKALLLSLPLYALGALAAIFINRNYCANNSMWSTLKWYGGLVHDGFLVPQILLNIFRDSRDKVLSVPFYIGTTLIRILPYGYYLLWKNGSFISISNLFEGSYLFGTPSDDLSSSTTAWDVIIPLGSLLFAAIIYLQQRCGGRCFVPRRFRINSVAYEKVPLTSDYS